MMEAVTGRIPIRAVISTKFHTILTFKINTIFTDDQESGYGARGSSKTATTSWGYEDGRWKGPGPALLVIAVFCLHFNLAIEISRNAAMSLNFS
jgi:hypothetical protein